MQSTQMWQQDRVAPPAICVAFLRHQMLPGVRVPAGGCEEHIRRHGSDTRIRNLDVSARWHDGAPRAGYEPKALCLPLAARKRMRRAAMSPFVGMMWWRRRVPSLEGGRCRRYCVCDVQRGGTAFRHCGGTHQATTIRCVLMRHGCAACCHKVHDDMERHDMYVAI